MKSGEIKIHVVTVFLVVPYLINYKETIIHFELSGTELIIFYFLSLSVISLLRFSKMKEEANLLFYIGVLLCVIIFIYQLCSIPNLGNWGTH